MVFIFWNILGASATKIRMPDKAIKAYKNVFLLHSNHADASCNVSVNFSAQGKLDEAIKSCKKAISLI
jgi:tetratricopeptide (TPR) repeat protein